jgi:hypothetical protein
MNNHSIDELEDALHAGELDLLDGGTLAAIRRRGRRRRSVRRVLTGAGSIAAVGVVGLTLALTGTAGGDRGTDSPPVASDPPPRSPQKLSPLAERALAEVPGAVQVSAWQVVLPAPDATSDYWVDERSTDTEVVGDTVPLGKSYQGVTMFPAEAWPGWLYQGTLDFEQSQKDEDGGYPVGSTDTGILVEVGAAELACVATEGRPCAPAMMTRTADGQLHYEWGMGTDDFLTPGSDMEVFLDEDYSDGAAGTIAIAGRPGTDVAHVEFVTTLGEVVEGRVSTTLVEGASMMFAPVPGELAKVVAYDGAGEVVEDHPLKECDTPVECEVR